MEHNKKLKIKAEGTREQRHHNSPNKKYSHYFLQHKLKYTL